MRPQCGVDPSHEVVLACSTARGIDLSAEIRPRRTEGLQYAVDGVDAWMTASVFDESDKGAVHAGPMRQVFLRQARCLAHRTQARADRKAVWDGADHAGCISRCRVFVYRQKRVRQNTSSFLPLFAWVGRGARHEVPMETDTLDALLRRAEDDDPAASARFMNAAMVVIRRSLGAWANSILVDRGMFDDAAQEAALRVWVNRSRCRATTPDQTAGWIATIARMTAVDQLRASGPRERTLDLETATVRALIEPESDAEPDASAQRLVELSWSLGRESSELLWSRLVLGQSWAEIGTDRQISWTAARRRYQRAVERLRVLALTDSVTAPSRSLLRRIAGEETARDPDSPTEA